MEREPVEGRTREWLEGEFEAGVNASILDDRQVFDAEGNPRRMSRKHFNRLVRKLKLFRWLDRLEFGSFLDVASGWEHYPYLVHARYGAEGYYSDLVHELNLPTDGLVYGKLDHAVTVRFPPLPFRDGAFDVVLCSEVLEHLVRPVEAIAELMRVARRYVIMTSLEALALGRWHRLVQHWRVDTRVPHVERNFFLMSELDAIFGPGLEHENVLFTLHEPADPFAPPDVQAAAYAHLNDRQRLEDALVDAVREGKHGPAAMGILLVKAKPGAPVRPAPAETDRALVRWLIDQTAAEERQGQTVLAEWEVYRRRPHLLPPELAPERPVSPALCALLRCPGCTGDLVPDGLGVRCVACGETFRGERGVPILYPPANARALVTEETALDVLCGDDARRRAVARGTMRRLRRNERPPGVLRRAAWRVDRAFFRHSGS